MSIFGMGPGLGGDLLELLGRMGRLGTLGRLGTRGTCEFELLEPGTEKRRFCRLAGEGLVYT